MPNPYAPEFLTQLYDKAGLHNNGIELDLDAVLVAWASSRKQHEAFAVNCDLRRAFHRLIQDGLIVNKLGMDFSEVQAKRYGLLTKTGDELRADMDVQLIREAFFPTRVHNHLWQHDMPYYHKLEWPYRQSVSTLEGPHPHQLFELAPGLSNRERDLLNSFRRDGFVRIDSWDGLDMDALEGASRPILEQWSGTQLGGRPEIQGALKPLMDNDGLLKRLARGYLGPHVDYHGDILFKLKGPYMNTAWHHDGCGSRLKAFIYLTGVDESSYPTQIMAGTNRWQWYGPTIYGWTSNGRWASIWRL
jgi:hypothetical protein